MTHLTKDNSVTSDALLIQDDLCEVCAKKDEEDLYIVFNILYRIVIGDNFYKGSEVSRECFDLDLLSSEIIQTKEKDCRISLERLQEFRNNLSSQTLIELMALQKFDLLLREIFKPKYIKIQDATCKHTQLAVTFIRNFNLKNKEAFENSESERNQFIQIVEKMDSLYNKVKKLKSEIESCHNEIDGLSESIIKKLFPNRSHMVGKKEEKSEEDESDYEDPNSEMYDSVQKKIFMNPKTSSGSVSTAVSREISGGRSSSASSNSDKLAEVISTENQSLNQKKK